MDVRLIDANAFKKCWKPGTFGETIGSVIDEQPTIDPETLPIVQELRQEIDRLKNDGKQDLWAVERKRREQVEEEREMVKKDRDNAVNTLRKMSWMFESCYGCKHSSIKCKNNYYWCEESGENHWEW